MYKNINFDHLQSLSYHQLRVYTIHSQRREKTKRASRSRPMRTGPNNAAPHPTNNAAQMMLHLVTLNNIAAYCRQHCPRCAAQHRRSPLPPTGDRLIVTTSVIDRNLLVSQRSIWLLLPL